MFDPEVLEHPIGKEALKLLSESGILLEQIECDRKRLQDGDGDQDTESLAEEIKKFRYRAGILRTLHETGEDLRRKENEQ